MTDFLVLATSTGVFTNEKGESFDCRYIIVNKADCVKPQIYKCTKDALETASKLRGKHCLFSFDEKQRVNGVKENTPTEKTE